MQPTTSALELVIGPPRAGALVQATSSIVLHRLVPGISPNTWRRNTPVLAEDACRTDGAMIHAPLRGRAKLVEMVTIAHQPILLEVGRNREHQRECIVAGCRSQVFLRNMRLVVGKVRVPQCGAVCGLLGSGPAIFFTAVSFSPFSECLHCGEACVDVRGETVILCPP